MKRRSPRQVLRRLRVSAQYARRAHGQDVCVPWIRLQGLWLEAAGFAVGSTVCVRVSQGRVVLTLHEASFGFGS